VLGYERAKQKEAADSILSNRASHNNQKLRRLVYQAWVTAGKPLWDIDRTLGVAIAVDARLERESQGNPAPRFRVNRTDNNLGYLPKWVIGCKFEWLRKRQVGTVR